MTGFQHAQCGSCHAPIIWAETPAGERMPVDAAPSSTGDLSLNRRDNGEPPLVRVVKASLRYGRADLRLSHFATCPDADQHRRRPKPAPVGRWLAANSPADLPYPCRCHSSEGCRGGGKHCPCWGRSDLDHLPKACCARRAAQPLSELETIA